MKTTIVVTICLLGSISGFSQTLEYYDNNWEPTSKERAAYYREITYDENRKPVGLVRDYYTTGELQFEGRMISVNPDTLDGNCTWYYKNGQKSEEAIYRQGAIVEGPRNWSENGKEEGVLDQSGFFYSQAFRSEFLTGLSEETGDEWPLDTITVDLLLKVGVSNHIEGNMDVASVLYKLSYDLSVILKDEVFLAKSSNNLGGIHHSQGRSTQALIWFKKAEEIQQRLNLDEDLAKSYNNIGDVLHSQGNLAQALIWHEKAKEIRKRLNLISDLAVSYNNIALVYESQGNSEKALIWHKKAKGIQEELNLETDLAISYNNIGTIYQTQGNLEQALIWYKKARRVQERLNLSSDLAGSYNNTGSAFHALGNLEQALIWHGKAMEIQERLNLEVDLAITYNCFGGVYRSQGNLVQALIWHKKAKEIQERLNLDVELSSTYVSIAETYQFKGNLEQALIWYKKAKDIQESLNLEVDLATLYNDIGTNYQAQGNLEKALNWYKKAKDIQERLKLEVGLATSYHNIAFNNFSQGNFKQALVSYNKAIEIQKKLNLNIALATSSNNVGLVYQTQGDFKQALFWYQKAKAIVKKMNLEVTIARSYNSIGNIYLSLKNFKKSLKWLKKAKKIQEKLNLESDLSITYNNIGGACYAQKKFKQAFFWFKKAMEIQGSLNLEVDLARSYRNIASNYFYLARPDSAFYFAKKNVQLNESIRNINKGSSIRHLYIDNSMWAIEIGVVSAYKLHKFQSSFSLSEKNKSRGLQDLLNEQSINVANLPEELLANIASNRNQLTALNQALSQDNTIENRKNLAILRDSLYQVRTQLEDQVKSTAPEYANLVYPETVTSEQVRLILDKEEVLVSYFTGGLKTFAFIQTPTDLQVIDLGASDSIQPLIGRFRRDLIPQQKAILTSETPNRFQQAKLNQQFYQLSSQLYQKLWAPLDSTGLLEDKEVILVPDGFLNYLPFELLVKDTIQKPFQDYQYLVESFAISYYPSATVLHFERTHEELDTKPEKAFFGLAISNFENALCTEDGNSLNKLSNTTSSVNSIHCLFNSEKSKVLFNEEANRDYFSSPDLKNYRYLHFATHGQINSEKPEFSNILLHDACLNLYEIFELEFNADLVTLSACETGLGKLVRGEGMVGFTRALMYAGTPSVILSLWEVGDDSTKDLFVNYYSKLSKDGSQKYVPLREVQLQMIESGKYSNPYFWAPFVFIGERVSKF